MSFQAKQISTIAMFSVFLLACFGCVSVPVEIPQPPPGSIPITCTVEDDSEKGEKEILLWFVQDEKVSEFLIRNKEILKLEEGKKQIWIARPKETAVSEDEILTVHWTGAYQTPTKDDDWELHAQDKICVTTKIEIQNVGFYKVTFWDSVLWRISSIFD